MRYLLSLSVFLIVSLNPAFAEWTGDNVEGMHSGMIINNFIQARLMGNLISALRHSSRQQR